MFYNFYRVSVMRPFWPFLFLLKRFDLGPYEQMKTVSRTFSLSRRYSQITCVRVVVDYAGWWFGVVWTEWTFIFPNNSAKYQFFYSSLSSNDPGNNGLFGIQFHPPTSNDDLCLPYYRWFVFYQYF